MTRALCAVWRSRCGGGTTPAAPPFPRARYGSSRARLAHPLDLGPGRRGRRSRRGGVQGGAGLPGDAAGRSTRRGREDDPGASLGAGLRPPHRPVLGGRSRPAGSGRSQPTWMRVVTPTEAALARWSTGSPPLPAGVPEPSVPVRAALAATPAPSVYGPFPTGEEAGEEAGEKGGAAESMSRCVWESATATASGLGSGAGSARLACAPAHGVFASSRRGNRASPLVTVAPAGSCPRCRILNPLVGQRPQVLLAPRSPTAAGRRRPSRRSAAPRHPRSDSAAVYGWWPAAPRPAAASSEPSRTPSWRPSRGLLGQVAVHLLDEIGRSRRSRREVELFADLRVGVHGRPRQPVLQRLLGLALGVGHGRGQASRP